MSDPRYDKLVGLWRAGQIDDEKLKRGLFLLHSISTREGAVLANENPHGSEFEDLAKIDLTDEFNEQSPLAARHEISHPDRGRLIGFVALGVLAAWMSALFLNWLVPAILHDYKKFEPANALVWTVVLLGIGGIFVGYNRRVLGWVSLPLFVFLLLAPLWSNSTGSKVPSAPARMLSPVYNKAVRQAEYGENWPFPAYPVGLLRCDIAKVGPVSRPVVTIELGGLRYGLNGAARDFGFPDSRSQMAKHPEWGTYQLGASDKMIESAIANCQ